LSGKPIAIVIDDELQIRKLLRVVLVENGYDVIDADTGKSGLAEIATRHPDVVLLDLGLPDIDGNEVLKRLREWSHVPVLILSVRESAEQKVAALDMGADDYVTKPFDATELLARLRAIQRRGAEQESSAYFQAGHLAIDFNGHIVTVNGHEVKLTATEYGLLRVLALNAGKVVTHRHLLREVWGPNATDRSQYLRVYMNHLRKKIELPRSKQKLLKTESGIGYRLLPADAKSLSVSQ
jgi:two-component system KDP operon response regulator KdpE